MILKYWTKSCVTAGPTVSAKTPGVLVLFGQVHALSINLSMTFHPEYYHSYKSIKDVRFKKL